MKADNNQDLSVRTKAYALAVIKMLETLPRSSTYRILGDQLLRSATSVGANFVESRAASSKRDFVNFLGHALKSANESKFWLALIKDSSDRPSPVLEALLKETQELANILGACIVTAKGKRNF